MLSILGADLDHPPVPAVDEVGRGSCLEAHQRSPASRACVDSKLPEGAASQGSSQGPIRLAANCLTGDYHCLQQQTARHRGIKSRACGPWDDLQVATSIEDISYSLSMTG